jgi:hypothetical protein
MTDLDQARQLLPLPALMAKLGHGGSAYKSAKCPFHDDSVHSFSIFRGDGGRWRWKCFGACATNGDEVDYIERAKGMTRKAALDEYGRLTGTNGNTLSGGAITAPRKGAPVATQVAMCESSASPAQSSPPATITPLTEKQIGQVAKWRGYSRSFVAKLSEQSVIGTYERKIAFPVTGGVHYRLKDRTWRYTPGAKCTLFEFGKAGSEVNVFESQWDALAVADKLALPVIATRGASNAKLLSGQKAQLVIWPQNDAPGRKWAKDVMKLVPGCRVVVVPEAYNDANEWAKSAQAGALLNAYFDAQTNLPVPVLAEVAGRLEIPGGEDEVRESTRNNLEPLSREGAGQDSRGGQNSLDGNGAQGEPATGLDFVPHETPVQNLSSTLGGIVHFLSRYVTFPMPEQADVIALWIAHTHVFTAFRFSPYLHVCSPEKRCGKSRLLECIQLLVPRPEMMVRPSEASLYRIIDGEKPTVLLDEVDTIFSERSSDAGSEAMRAILNAGFQKGATVAKCTEAGRGIARFEVFCPKVIAGIGRIPDTVRDRSIDIRLDRQTSENKAQRFRLAAAEEEAAPLRGALERWAAA